MRAASNLRLGGNCQTNGPSRVPSASTPEAKKLASGMFDVLQPLDVGDPLVALDREAEVLGRLGGPVCEACRLLVR